MFQLFQFGYERGPLVIVWLIDNLTEQIPHFDYRNSNFFKQGVKDFVFGQKDRKQIV
jgi:hypothetical protein